jgi:hypothetical protein
VSACAGVDILRHSNDALGVHVRVRALTVRDLASHRGTRRAPLDRVLEFETCDHDDDDDDDGDDADVSNERCIELHVLRRPRRLAEL